MQKEIVFLVQINFPDKPSALIGSCYFDIIYDQKHLYQHRQISFTAASECTVRVTQRLLKLWLFHSVAFGCSGWWKVCKHAVKPVKPSVWSLVPETFGSSSTAGTQELGKMAVDFEFDLLDTLTSLQFVSSCVQTSSPARLFALWSTSGSWEHAEEPSAPASVPAAPQFLGHVFFVFFLLYVPRTSSRRGHWAAGPLSVLVGPSVSWFLNPWNLSSSSTGTCSVSVSVAEAAALPDLYICMCIFIIPWRAFGFECCAMVEFVHNDEKPTFLW